MNYSALPIAVFKMRKMLKNRYVSNPNGITKYYIVHYRQISQNVKNEHFAIFFYLSGCRRIPHNIAQYRIGALHFATLRYTFCVTLSETPKTMPFSGLAILPPIIVYYE